MSEWTKTTLFIVAAFVAAGAAWATRPVRTPPELFSDRGQPLFPDFPTPDQAAAIEIVSYDEALATAKPFKVERKNWVWVLPSHEEYPAEAKDKLEKIATGVKHLAKDDIRSDREEDHEVLGVIDPLDDKAGSLKGRGKRVKVYDQTGAVLADFIVGRELGKEKKDFRFVRLPGKRRTYQVKIEAEANPSGDFYDWIDRDLLKVDRYNVTRIEIDRYRVNEQKRALEQGELLTLKKDNWEWKMDGVPETEEVAREKVDEILAALDDLKIADVRRKPTWITPDLKKLMDRNLTPEESLQLQLLAANGFFLMEDGKIVSNEGEFRLWTDKGVKYVLRFGELASGGDAKEERRNILISAEFDEASIPPPQIEEKDDEAEKTRKTKERDDKVTEGKKLAEELNARFADWYYVIPGETYKKMRLSRPELVRPKPVEKK